MRFILVSLIFLLVPSTSWGNDPVYMRCVIGESYEVFRFAPNDQHQITRRSSGKWIPWCGAQAIVIDKELHGVCNRDTHSEGLDFMFHSYKSFRYTPESGLSEKQILCSPVTPAIQ
jgi:hypothetical protein